MPNVDRISRKIVAAEMRRFLARETSAFEFDDALFAIESDDPTVKNIIQRLWFHYDDLKDHTVVLTKPEWNYFYRLLLILESDRHIKVRITCRWSWLQLLALGGLLSLVITAYFFGTGFHLFLLAIPLGLTSMLIAYLRHRNAPTDVESLALDPFSTFAELWETYRSVEGFRKRRFPRELSGVQIRSDAMNRIMWIPTLIAWFLISPLVLFFQVFPQRGGDTTVVRNV